MKNKLIHFVTAGALAAGLAFAQGSQPATLRAHRNIMQQHRARISQELNLTDDQKAQAKTIFGQARETAKPVREKLKENRAALREAVKADNSAVIDRLATTRGNLMGKMLAIRSEASAKFYQVLTPEQRAKSDQLHQQFRERMHDQQTKRNNG